MFNLIALVGYIVSTLSIIYMSYGTVGFSFFVIGIVSGVSLCLILDSIKVISLKINKRG